MKRPEGFDPGSRRQAAPPPAAKRRDKAAAENSSKRTATPKQPARTPAQRPAPTPAAKPIREKREQATAAPATSRVPAAPPVAARPDRIARQELRRAARERRRYERSEVRRFTARSRRRRIGLLSGLGVVVALGALLAIAVFSPILALKEIRVEGTSRVDPELVRAAVADQMGTPLALLDTGRIEDELGTIPLIRDYSTVTLPPNTLLITVTERQPVAIVEAPSGWDLVDPAGIVIQNSAERPEGMPIISAGAKGGESFIAAVEVLLALPAELRERVDSISATTEDDVAFELGDTDQNVVWGSSERSDLKVIALEGLLTANKKNTDVDFNVSSPDIALVIDK